MTSVALLFVGAVLLVNGLTFCGFLDGRSGIPINLFVGFLLVVATAVTVADTTGDQRLSLFSAVGFTLFGFTYLGVAGQALLHTDGKSLGVYCSWATVIALVLAAVNMPETPGMGWLWVAWTGLFLAFAIALTTDSPRFGQAAGVLAVWLAVSSTTVPGLLMINETWDDTPVWAIAIAQVSGIIVYLGTAFAFPDSRRADGTATRAPAPVSVGVSD